MPAILEGAFTLPSASTSTSLSQTEETVRKSKFPLLKLQKLGFVLPHCKMTHVNKRRILSLPAVYPCEAICPATLLSSLISLCNEIMAKRVLGSYPIHKKAISESIRETGVLLSIFEELLDCEFGSVVPESVVLCLSELHFALQKLLFLLQDCSRNGAKLWMLMKSDSVLSEFRVQIRSIATSLDVFPLELIDLQEETKELLRLLSIQAWTVQIQLERTDDRAIRTVRSVFDLFTRGINPNPIDLKRVLDHLNIRTWSDCNDEFSFLEEELFFHIEKGDDEVSFLSCLTGFIFHCRVVLFPTVDSKRVDQVQVQPITRSKSLDWLSQEGLQCSISLELMSDPVTVCTGQTYDRISIKKWIKSGCVSCPVSGKSLTSTDLVPNLAVRRLIEQFCNKNGVNLSEPSTKQKREVDKTSAPFSTVSDGAVKLTVSFLVRKLSNGSSEEVRKATFEMRKMSKCNIFNRQCLVKAESVPWLLYLLSSSDPSIQDNSIAALLNISKHPIGQKAVFESGGICLITDMVKFGLKNEVKQNAAAILFYLSSVEMYRTEICNINEAVPTLVDLVKTGTYRGKKNALVSLYGLLESSENHPKIIQAGTVPVLVSLLSCERGDIVYDSIAVLEKIAERYEGTIAVLKSMEISRIVDVIGSCTTRSGKENCVGLLYSLCVNGGKNNNLVVSKLGKMPSFMSGLYKLVLDGTSQGRKKARALLELIHGYNDETDYPMVNPGNQSQDRIIHVL
ncbi:hypothetical protein LUZ60_003217 [Juncus effusus]|nr:hypothetical protein LUZ60_003217 [Juncus effusus]